MPFTALNQAAPPSSKPPANVSANISAAPGWIKEDFSELPTDVTDSIVALWNGEGIPISREDTVNTD